MTSFGVSLMSYRVLIGRTVGILILFDMLFLVPCFLTLHTLNDKLIRTLTFILFLKVTTDSDSNKDYYLDPLHVVMITCMELCVHDSLTTIYS